MPIVAGRHRSLACQKAAQPRLVIPLPPSGAVLSTRTMEIRVYKRYLATVIMALPLLTVVSCHQQVCRPYAIREDSYHPGRYWLCNKDGTKEDPIQGPTAPPQVGPATLDTVP